MIDNDNGILYSLKALLNKQPVELATGIKSLLNVLVIFAVIDWTGAQVAGVLLLCEVIFGLLVKAKTTNNAKLAEVGDTTSTVIADAAAATAGAVSVVAKPEESAVRALVRDELSAAAKRARPPRTR